MIKKIYDIQCDELKAAAKLCESADKGIVQLLIQQADRIEELNKRCAELISELNDYRR